MSDLYPKIWSPFLRHTEGPNRNRFDTTRWTRPEFELLEDLDWEWTEKVDGTNIRLIWNGYFLLYGGRTDEAQLPVPLVRALDDLVSKDLVEQCFGAQPAVLFGEGYGAKIQKSGSLYRPDPGFVLFDVRVGPWWLRRPDVEDVAQKLGIDVVPVHLRGTIGQAIDLVTGNGRGGNPLDSAWGDFPAEGLVGRPPLGVLGRDGDRLLVKIKAKDFAPLPEVKRAAGS